MSVRASWSGSTTGSRTVGRTPRKPRWRTRGFGVSWTRKLHATLTLNSHARTPTDRHPDIPRNTLDVFAGCSQERANTQRTYRLASCLHGSYCSSGNASPLADNAILGIRAIEQFRAHAVGTSQRSQSGVELDASEVWSVQGKRGTCVTMWSPSSKPGS
jgi:hypothetical protein